jgi:hypothetical protein
MTAKVISVHQYKLYEDRFSPNIALDTSDQKIIVPLESVSHPVCFNWIAGGGACCVQFDEVNFGWMSSCSFIGATHGVGLGLGDRGTDWSSSARRVNSRTENL